jgi:hypothetical protein
MFEKSTATVADDPHECLIPDPRAGLSPAELVERKLMAVLRGGPNGRKEK